MNFSFDEDQKSLGHTVAQVLADFPALTAPELTTPHNDDAWRAVAELGLFALLVPEKHDGVGLSLVDLALAVEALGAGLAPPSIVATLIATDVISRHGSDAQKNDLLPRIAAGRLKLAIAILEKHQGYDVEDVETEIVDGLIVGRKILVADAADAELIITLVRHNGRPTLVLVDPRIPGVTFQPHDDLDPTSGHCAVAFDHVPIGENVIIANADPEDAVGRLLDVAATLHAALLTGISARMLDTSVEYARNRVQFDRPIGAFQAIKHRCADMAVAVEAARSATYYAFWSVAEDAPDHTRAASMAKAYAGVTAREVCNETIQVHGGMGFTWELGLHRFLRRTKVVEFAFGDEGWHNERVVAQTLAALGPSDEILRDAA